MHLSQSLSEEEKRYVREGFKSDEELSLYDLLLKDNLSKPEIKKLKDVAIDLLAKIKGHLSAYWIHLHLQLLQLFLQEQLLLLHL